MLIIDGNNLLHAAKPGALAGLDELGLCRALGQTPWCERGEVRIVCDGDPGVLGRLESPVAGVELIYSGRGRSADAVIEQMIAQSSAPRRLIVVSSDRAIRRAAERRRAKAWTSERFARELAQALAQRRASEPDVGQAADPHLSPGQVERWLEAFGFDPEHPQRGEPEDDDSKHWPPW